MTGAANEAASDDEDGAPRQFELPKQLKQHFLEVRHAYLLSWGMLIYTASSPDSVCDANADNRWGDLRSCIVRGRF